MKKKYLAGLIYVMWLIFCIVGNAQGDTISSNLMYPAEGTRWGIPSFIQMAFSFTVPSDTNYSFEAIGIPLYVQAGPHIANLKILESENNLPGQALESLTVIRDMAFESMIIVDSISTPTLFASKEYWLYVTPGHPDTTLYLRWARDPAGQIAYTTYGGDWTLSTVSQNYFPGAFEIYGTPIPEPATILLISAGLAGLLLLKKDKLCQYTS
jgi:hypothetical protein